MLQPLHEKLWMSKACLLQIAHPAKKKMTGIQHSKHLTKSCTCYQHCREAMATSFDIFKQNMLRHAIMLCDHH